MINLVSLLRLLVYFTSETNNLHGNFEYSKKIRNNIMGNRKHINGTYKMDLRVKIWSLKEKTTLRIKIMKLLIAMCNHQLKSS